MNGIQYFSPDRLLSTDAVRNAMHALFTSEYASVAEEKGIQLPNRDSGVDLEEWTPQQPDAIMLPFGWWLIGRVEQAWGYKVGLVFHHADIRSEDDQSDALSLLFLGLSGSGAHLLEEPRFAEGLERADEVLNSQFDSSPFYHEMSELWELANSILNPDGTED